MQIFFLSQWSREVVEDTSNVVENEPLLTVRDRKLSRVAGFPMDEVEFVRRELWQTVFLYSAIFTGKCIFFPSRGSFIFSWYCSSLSRQDCHYNYVNMFVISLSRKINTSLLPVSFTMLGDKSIFLHFPGVNNSHIPPPSPNQHCVMSSQ